MRVKEMVPPTVPPQLPPRDTTRPTPAPLTLQGRRTLLGTASKASRRVRRGQVEAHRRHLTMLRPVAGHDPIQMASGPFQVPAPGTKII
jgi:hypothetical protein